MLAIEGGDRPRWRSTTLAGFQSLYFDGEWYYHFKCDGRYEDMRYVDVLSPNADRDALVLAAIRKIKLVATRQAPLVWRIFGYVDNPVDARIP